ncbi:uncharacterized protein DS421_16g547260 [Arachis hypogaea]|nr:uncharacterized protein DS421_16g547260 [Arachis hypogaea]
MENKVPAGNEEAVKSQVQKDGGGEEHDHVGIVNVGPRNNNEVNDMYIEEIIRETRMGLQNSPKKHDSQSNENGYRRGAEQVEDNITLIDPSIPPGFEEHITKIKTQREVKTLVARKTDPMSLVALLELEDPKETPERRWLQILHMPCMIPLKKYLSVLGTWQPLR